MKLFVRSDLERCARLALRKQAQGDGVEVAVFSAVDVVAGNTPEVYTQDHLREAAQLAAQLAATSSVSVATERAVNAVTNTRHFTREQP